MKVIIADRPRDIEVLELHTFADEHIGEHCCDMPRLKSRIEYIANTPNAYCVLNGDILDYASRSSIGDIETREFNIMGQLEKAAQLGLVDKYSPGATMIFLHFGTSTKHQGGYKRISSSALYSLYESWLWWWTKEGAKAIRLADMASIIDADIYIHSHTHLPMIMKQGFFRTNRRSSTVENVTKLFVNTAANLDYGGYGEAGEFKPSSKDTPVIYMRGSKKEMWAKL